jgi:uncharacterized repeat protein (TIGR03803 family)
VFCAGAVASPAQTFTSLFSFDGTNGASPQYGALVQGFDGNFYGTTQLGGTFGYGTVFKITAGGTLTTVHSFNFADGAFPLAGLLLSTNGNFYGTAEQGGVYGDGTVFEITPGGTLTTLHSFNGTDGSGPQGGLIQATNGNFYGTTYAGGANNFGTVFKITTGGTLTTLHSFAGYPTEGANPSAGLLQGIDGNFYGTTTGGGAFGYGTVFKVYPDKVTERAFDSTDGASPHSGLIQQISTGNLFGTSSKGGGNGGGTIFEVIRIPSSTLTLFYDFCAQADCMDGDSPYGGLLQATDGNFYGTTAGGGANGYGTAFAITTAGTLTTLYSFEGTDGAYPYAGLLQATDGNFYGTTNGGGANNDGTVFGLSVGLSPFVQTLPTSGKVGAAVIILGNDLSGATAVSFGGTAATFTVASSTEITTTVPPGAMTGAVEVTTAGGSTLDSNLSFRVTPQIASFSPTSGPVGTLVAITGVSLAQTTEVTFGGVAATSFTVNSDTQVMATVPAGAKTGTIGIVTAGGTVTSATSFTTTE